MPTYERTERFIQDLQLLSREQRRALDRAVPKFVDALRRGDFRKGLRVKGVKGQPGLYELTFAPDGRALFRYGPPRRPGHAHIIWERVGTHDVFNQG